MAKIFLVCALFCVLINAIASDMPADMKAKLDEIQKSCMEKNKITPEMLDNISKGTFADNKDLKCFLQCAMDKLQLTTNGKLVKDQAMKFADMAPKDLQDGIKKAVTTCSAAPNTATDPCEAAIVVAKCMKKEFAQFPL